MNRSWPLVIGGLALLSSYGCAGGTSLAAAAPRLGGPLLETTSGTNALYLDGSPVVQWTSVNMAEWTVNEEGGKATFHPPRGKFELTWTAPPSVLYVDKPNTTTFGARLLAVPDGSVGTSIRVSFGSPVVVDPPGLPDKIYVGRGGSDGKLYPHPEAEGDVSPDDRPAAERANLGRHEDTKTVKYHLPPAHGAKTTDIVVVLEYGPQVVYHYKE